MGESCSIPLVGARTPGRGGALERDYAALGERLARRGIDIEAVKRQGRRLRGRGAVLGRRHRRHAVRALPGAGRAARHLREARGLRGDPAADAGDAAGVAAHPVGQGGRPGGAARQGGGARARVRRDELEHLPGPAGAGALLQVRLAQPHRRRRCGRRRSSTTSNASSIGQALGSKALTVWIGDGSNFPGQSHFARAFERYLDAMARDLRGAAGRLAAVHRAQDVRAGVLLDGGAGLGHQLPDRAGARASRRSAWSTSGTTRRT